MIFSLTLSAYDDAALRSGLDEFAKRLKEIPVTIIDDTNTDAFTVENVTASAFFSGDEGIPGSLSSQPGSDSPPAEREKKLLAAHLGRRGDRYKNSSLADAMPFKVPRPELRFEVYDETDFLLHTESFSVYLDAQVDEHGTASARPARWIVEERTYEDSLDGTATRVVFRIGEKR